MGAINSIDGFFDTGEGIDSGIIYKLESTRYSIVLNTNFLDEDTIINHDYVYIGKGEDKWIKLI